MPRDKKLSHQRVLEAAKKEFLEKGFEGASIRTIGSSARMTSAGLYRHCKDKEDLFVQIVAPLLREMNKRFAKHKRVSYEANSAYTARLKAFSVDATGSVDPVDPPKAIYTVSYDANGGTKAPAQQTKTEGEALTLSSQIPVREGCYNLHS